MSNQVFLKQLMSKNGQFGDLYGNFDVIRKQAVLIKNGPEQQSPNILPQSIGRATSIQSIKKGKSMERATTLLPPNKNQANKIPSVPGNMSKYKSVPANRRQELRKNLHNLQANAASRDTI